MALNWVETPESSNIIKFGYDAEKQELQVTFKGGKTYSYAAVPPELAEQFRQSPSKGKFFSAHIKTAFEFKKL